MVFLKNHFQLIFSFLMIFGVCFSLYCWLNNQDANPKLEIKNFVVEHRDIPINIAKIVPAEIEHKDIPIMVEKLVENKIKTEEKKKSEEIKIKGTPKTEKYRGKKSEVEKGSGGGDKKGFPSFFCEEFTDKREFLHALNRLGVNEFAVIKGDEVIGVMPFDANGFGLFNKRPPLTDSGFQRFLTNRETEALGIEILLRNTGIDTADIRVGFFLMEKIVIDSVKKYLHVHNLNFQIEELKSFQCRYSDRGFEVLNIYK